MSTTNSAPTAADLTAAKARARDAARRLGALPDGAPETDRRAARRESEQASVAYEAMRAAAAC